MVTGYYKPAYVYGGPAKSISILCEGMARQGADVTVFTTNANGRTRLDVPLNTPMQVDGVTVRYFPLAYNGLGFFYAPALGQALAEQLSEFDLVAIETIWGHQLGVAAQACRTQGIPYTVSVRGQLFGWSLGTRRLKKRLYMRLLGRRYLERAAALHCTDPREAAAVANLQFGPPTFVVPNGIDTSPYDQMPQRGHWRRAFGIADDATVLLFLGRLTQIKRPDIAVATLAACREVNLKTHLIFAGPDQDGLADTLQAQARRLGCQDSVHLTGLLNPEQVRYILSDSDLLIGPSEIQENFGMAAAEALAAGVPVLVSEGIPVGAWAEGYGAGRMVACDARMFAEAAIEMISSSEALIQMGINGRELVRSKFDIIAVAQQMIRHYESIIAYGHPAETSWYK